MNTMTSTLLAAGADVVSESGPVRATPGTWEALAENILFTVVIVGVITTVLAIGLCFWRMLKGPSLVDRGLASDTVAFQVVALVILLTVALRSLAFFDAVLIVSLMGFASTVAFAQFVGRRRSAQ